MPSDIGPTAGIVKTPGVDDVLEQIEASVDAIEFRNRFFEGEQLRESDLERTRRLLQAIVPEVNKRLGGRGRIIGASPETQGFGARFYGRDAERRDYVIDLHNDDEQRMADKDQAEERLVRETVDMLVGAILQKRAEYLSRTGETTRGIA